MDEDTVEILEGFIDTPVATEQCVRATGGIIGDETKVLVTEYIMRSGFRYELVTTQDGGQSMYQRPPLPGTYAWHAIHGDAQDEEEGGRVDLDIA